MNELTISILTLVFGSIIPILIYKSRTRSEVVLGQKSPFIIDLFVSLNNLHVRLRNFSAVISLQTEKDREKEFFDGLGNLVNDIKDHQARAKLYLHLSTNKYVDEFVSTSFELIHSRGHHKWMLSQTGAFTSEELNKEYQKWSKLLPNKLDELFIEKITPSLKIELNGYIDSLWLDRNLIL